ncbi:hypothetical protein KC19_9G115600 [Ceratodon purpureus]|uniref:Protein kinase domain-containing protein n=1 Tax=Ceratodon purpureus TaxID=3225 RepID=A0A8T0GSV8_CERPU|nr:hypothetical protein KC19_9G115600 [Ceratodon purpureus]
MPTGGGLVLDANKRSYPLVASEYKLFEEVGQGVSATVYRAHCVTFNEIVAIKSLDLEKCNSNLDDIRREAQTMSLINHQNVVKAYCSFVVGQNLWVVMPYMAGGSCLHIMKAAHPEGFDEPVIATVLKESLKALEYLHRHGHIHRDVKAGNILVDSNGSVKLGDFGVSACMFDTGDRQRSRNTFVGTPCWMAPEVMEQLHGYDFKADIWSFGITALELAHGHAPFSKYPPMKVLLMTLQNAPPGLDYERDKKFSKSFKEMIAMCLVKDPAKRPTAEKLLRHSFFKQARSFDYISRHILDGLPPLGERVKTLKIKDANRLAQKIQPYDEQEAQSQNEYKRGVSAWNFNIEDLKAQAALIQDDDEVLEPKPLKVAIDKDVEEVLPPQVTPVKDDTKDAALSPLSPLAQPALSHESSSERIQLPVTIHSIIAETTNDAGERVTRVRSGPLPNPVQQPKSANVARTGPPSGRKEPKHIGRFDVWDDHDVESPSWHGSPKESRKSEETRREREDKEQRKGDDRDRKEGREQRRPDERSERDEMRRVASATFGSERVLSSIRGLTMDDRDRDRDKDQRQGGRSGEDSGRMHRERSFNGPVSSNSERSSFDQKSTNGLATTSRQLSGGKEVSDDKVKAPAQKGPGVLQKGRFSVTSDDTDFEEPPHLSSRWTSNAQVSQHAPPLQHSSSLQHAPSLPHSPSLQHMSSLGGQTTQQSSQITAPIAAIIPQLQQILQHGQKQQDNIMHLIQSLSPQDIVSLHSVNSMSRFSRTSSANSAVEHSVEVSTDRERELLHQVSDLQSRMATLVDELQTVKLRNVQLERQLNAIYNKEEEERIRKEEAAKDDR